GFELGNGTSDVPFESPLAGLLPWMTYHFRAVASNPVGVVFGDDATFTLPAPTLLKPSLSTLPNVTLPQGGSTSVPFTVSDPDTPLDQLTVRAQGNNPVLVPSIPVDGSGDTRSLTLAPDPNHSGFAIITVNVSDDAGTASRAFHLTVAPRFDGSSFYLTNAQIVSAEAWRFSLVDADPESGNYTVEYRADLSPAHGWTVATNVTALGGGVFEVATGPPQRDTGFYRVMSVRLPQVNFDSTELSVEEGAGAAGAVVVFNGSFSGALSYAWTDISGADHAGTVPVNGTTAVIPIPTAENGFIGPLGYLTLRLESGPGYALGEATAGTVIIEENDADWQGVVQTPSGILGFDLRILRTNGVLQGQIKSGDPGFFPATELAQFNFTESV
ncbi:MAG TPA: hypothetical protein VLD18_07515, partial [Verrucomicrobiae bacterium]|nr:hypothetical protein [Verrucomicrobiae bacterium]